MFDVVDGVMERAVTLGAADVEVYAESGMSRRIKVYQQAVEQLTAARRRGVGVRVWRGGAVGHAYTSDLSERALDDVARRAVTTPRSATGCSRAYRRGLASRPTYTRSTNGSRGSPTTSESSSPWPLRPRRSRLTRA
jgi:predicted Zn-dependent protease